MRKRLTEFWPLDRHGTHAFLAISAVLAIFIFIIGLQDVFTPFFISLLLAYILHPFVNFGERCGLPRWAGTVCIYFFLCLCAAVFLFLIVPSVYQEFKQLSTNNEHMRALPEKVTQCLKKIASEHLSEENQQKVTAAVQNWFVTIRDSGNILKDSSLLLSQNILVQIGKIPSLLLILLLIPFYLFFLLNSLDKIWAFAETYAIPYEYREQLLGILQKIHLSLSAFFRGRLLICLLIGIIAWLGLWVLKVPFAFLFGFAIGFSTIIPLLGLLFLLPALILYIISGASVEYWIYLLAFYIFVQAVEMLLLTPFILGKEVELPPILLVLSILCFGHLFGVIGVILAVPIASTVKILFSEFIFPSFIALSEKSKDGNKTPAGE